MSISHGDMETHMESLYTWRHVDTHGNMETHPYPYQHLETLHVTYPHGYTDTLNVYIHMETWRHTWRHGDTLCLY